jgi:hypothetical protein
VITKCSALCALATANSFSPLTAGPEGWPAGILPRRLATKNGAWGAFVTRLRERNTQRATEVPNPSAIEHCIPYFTSVHLREISLFLKNRISVDMSCH